MQPDTRENMPGNTNSSGAPVPSPQTANTIAQNGLISNQAQKSSNPAPGVIVNGAQVPMPPAAADGQPKSSVQQALANKDPSASQQSDAPVVLIKPQDTEPVVAQAAKEPVNPEQHSKNAGQAVSSGVFTSVAVTAKESTSAAAEAPKTAPAQDAIMLVEAQPSTEMKIEDSQEAIKLVENADQGQDKKVLSQHLWGKAAPIDANAPMRHQVSDDEDVEDDESNISIDSTLREKCDKLQNNDGLFNLEANNYQVAILNGKLAACGMRLDFNETVLAQITKRRKEEAVREKEQRKKMQKKARQQAQNAKRMQDRAIKQKDKSPSESSYEYEASKRLNIQSFNAEPANDQPSVDIIEAVDGRISEPAQSSAVKALEIDNGDGLEQAPEMQQKADTEMPSAIAVLTDDPTKFEQKFTSEAGLSPTPRKSERSKSQVNYTVLAKGSRDPLDELDEHLAQKSKKQEADIKRIQVEETRVKVEALMKKLREHEAHKVLTQPLDKENPKYDEFKSKFKNLLIIEMGFKTNMYANTSDIIKDVKLMLFQQFNLLAAAGSDQFNTVNDFGELFDRETENLQDLPLTVTKETTGRNSTVSKKQPSRPDPVKKPSQTTHTVSKKQPARNDESFTWKDKAEKDQMVKDIGTLENAQKQAICEMFPEFISYGEKNAMTLTLGNMAKHPEQARKLVSYVRDQAKKINTRKRRQLLDAQRRADKQKKKKEEERLKSEQDGKPAAAGAAAAAGTEANQQLLQLLQLQQQQPGLQQSLSLISNLLNAQGGGKDGAGVNPLGAILANPSALQLLQLQQQQPQAANAANLQLLQQLQQQQAGQNTASKPDDAAKRKVSSKKSNKSDSSSSESDSD